MRRLSLAAILLVITAASPAFAQYTLNVLAPIGEPAGGVVLSGNTLYGVERDPDEIFSLPITGGTPTLLAPTDDGDSQPYNGLTLSGNTLYGATIYDGPYSLPISGGTITNLGGATDGYFVGGAIVEGDTVYAPTAFSTSGFGGIVADPTTGGGIDNLVANFSDTSHGEEPMGNLIASASGTTLYGTTTYGGTDNDGTIYKFSISDNAITKLASFNGTDGANPASSLVLSGNTLYGTTPSGGAFGDGVVFSLPVGGGTPTVLLSFNGADGDQPMAGLLVSNGVLYGTTYGGGAFNGGEVFSLPTTGGTPTLLESFDDTETAAGPTAGLVMDSNGDLFGTTFLNGSVFELAVPEPTSISLLAISSLGLLFRNRRTKSESKI
jgi:uncharacterized repeat protein (TIGR03803 family)